MIFQQIGKRQTLVISYDLLEFFFILSTLSLIKLIFGHKYDIIVLVLVSKVDYDNNMISYKMRR